MIESPGLQKSGCQGGLMGLLGRAGLGDLLLLGGAVALKLLFLGLVCGSGCRSAFGVAAEGVSDWLERLRVLVALPAACRLP